VYLLLLRHLTVRREANPAVSAGGRPSISHVHITTLAYSAAMYSFTCAALRVAYVASGWFSINISCQVVGNTCNELVCVFRGPLSATAQGELNCARREHKPTRSCFYCCRSVDLKSVTLKLNSDLDVLKTESCCQAIAIVKL